ncbi:MAG: MOSC domain-containing protein [Phototrophicaceae bacterium]
MHLLGIQVGKVQTHEYKGKEWRTGYMKKSVSGEVFVGELNLDGDEQHHKNFHGGIHRPVLMYSATHYDRWREELSTDLPYGSFAENFTVTDLDEDSVCIGDIYQIGDTVQVQVSQPRQPCNQIYQALGIRGIVNKIKANFRSGWYCRVLQTGTVSTGMPIQLIERLHPDWTVIRTHEVMSERKNRPQEAHELSLIEELQPTWRKKLAQAGKSS